MVFYGAVRLCYSTTHIHSRYDLLVWFEIQELSPTGEYVVKLHHVCSSK